MPEYYQEFEGIVLFQKIHKEKDALIKLFTKDYGKLMFYVRHFASPTNKLRASLFPFTIGNYLGRINKSGLSFLTEAKATKLCKPAIEDILVNAYATYISNLVDAVIEDRVVIPDLYQLYENAIQQIMNELPADVVTNIFEIKLLPFFGVDPNFNRCAVCHKQQGPFAYSFKYDSVLCQDHRQLDLHAVIGYERALHYIAKFQQIDLEKLDKIALSDSSKEQIRQLIDILYQEYVGLHLKSKSFIDSYTKFTAANTKQKGDST